MYGNEIAPKQAAKQLIELLYEYNVKLRQGKHKLIKISLFVYDKDAYNNSLAKKPLGLGITYKKMEGTKTQDIFIINNKGVLDKFYSEREMIKKYPAMKGTHKEKLNAL